MTSNGLHTKFCFSTSSDIGYIRFCILLLRLSENLLLILRYELNILVILKLKIQIIINCWAMANNVTDVRKVTVKER